MSHFGVSKFCHVSFLAIILIGFLELNAFIKNFSKSIFSKLVPLSAFFFKFHISPTTRKLLVHLRLLPSDNTNFSARSPDRRASPNLTACLHGPSTPRLTRHSPGRLASPNLTACLQGPFTVCCTRVAHHPSSLREPEVALSLHYRNQYHSSKFSPRIWGGNKSSHRINHISFHFQKSHFISFLKNFISHLKLISNFSSTILNIASGDITYRVRARCHMLTIMLMQYIIIFSKFTFFQNPHFSHEIMHKNIPTLQNILFPLETLST